MVVGLFKSCLFIKCLLIQAINVEEYNCIFPPSLYRPHNQLIVLSNFLIISSPNTNAHNEHCFFFITQAVEKYTSLWSKNLLSLDIVTALNLTTFSFLSELIKSEKNDAINKCILEVKKGRIKLKMR